MDLSIIWQILTKLIDICIVWFFFYYILKNVKNNSKMVLVIKTVIILLVVKIISAIFDLYTVGVLLEYVIEWGPLAIIVIFQPEIRGVLESIGKTRLRGRNKILTINEREKVVNEIMKSIEWMKQNHVGGLMVIEREVSLEDYIATSNKIYADVNASLIENIFYPGSPLHDGGIIIQGDKITCAGSIFKTSLNQGLSKKLGTRHRAALGISEESDAIALVVSEETGRISIAIDSELNYNLTNEEFRTLLLEELSPKTEIFFASEEKEREENINE